jgi:Rps23 Pro-64 3,4-dihydroxylase Tpa1-like proline 4-hydroxylase
VSGLINDSLLRSVRREIIDNVHFTPKETDIYKIHQSGDLANLSGLDPSALKLLPSLLTLRDSLYSPQFRAWVSDVSGAGPLSGTKTDMAVNVYAPGCHLLCHDDVIGTRRVSYILYLTDPDKPWQANWGGALRLYPTEEKTDSDGKQVRVPHYDFSKVIPPAWNQLSFFTVQPGQSFHDVEEVFKRKKGESEDDGGRIRMAISGWFHIPQQGEDGFEPGLEEKLAERSSLQQLQSKNDEFDLPQEQWLDYDDVTTDDAKDEEVEFDEKDMDFLIQYMTPQYLTPDTVEELSELFAEESSLQLANFLSQKFSARLRKDIESHDGKTGPATDGWATATPPHKHRYRFKHADRSAANASSSAYDHLLNTFLPSLAFRKWLSLATGLTLAKSSILARRFRKGLDYTLATGYNKPEAQLEFCLNVTPSKGWGADEEADDEADTSAENNGSSESTSKTKEKAATKEDEDDNVGGYELYMAGDDDDDEDDDDDAHSDHGVNIPPNVASATGAGNRHTAKHKKKAADPAIYQAGNEEDDGILFSNPANWNTLSVVLRDRGVLKFVKYVSESAEGDRWDVVGAVEVVDDGDDEEEAAED